MARPDAQQLCDYHFFPSLLQGGNKKKSKFKLIVGNLLLIEVNTRNDIYLLDRKHQKRRFMSARSREKRENIKWCCLFLIREWNVMVYVFVLLKNYMY